MLSRSAPQEDGTGTGIRPPEPSEPLSEPPTGPPSGAPDPELRRRIWAAVAVSPVRRLLSFAVAGFALMLCVGLVFGAQTAGPGVLRVSYAVVIFGIQVLFVLAFTMALRPPDIRVVAGAGLFVAATTDVAAVLPDQPGIVPLAVLAAVGFVGGVAGQMVRQEGRIRLLESLGATLVVVAGVTAYTTLIVLTRLPIGTQIITASLAAAGVALTVARLADTLMPWPRLSPQLPRGGLGVVVGPMLGTVTAAYLGSYLVGLDPTSAALSGLATAVAAVLADLSVGYAEVGRRPVGEPPTMWVARHLQGPLAGFALAAPLAYATSVVFFVPRF